jgi:hypothetical protein
LIAERRLNKHLRVVTAIVEESSSRVAEQEALSRTSEHEDTKMIMLNSM